MKQLTFDEVMLIWLEAEINKIEGRDILPVAQSKGFSSITEWRLATALRLGLDKKQWVLEAVSDPAKTLPNIIVGPYQGWSKFFDNKLVTTFEEAMEIPEFFEWCQAHDRVVPLAKNFPLPTKLIVLRKENGQLIHIEGGHRICAVAFANKIGKPIDFSKSEINIAVATINDEEIPQLLDFLRTGSSKN